MPPKGLWDGLHTHSHCCCIQNKRALADPQEKETHVFTATQSFLGVYPAFPKMWDRNVSVFGCRELGGSNSPHTCWALHWDLVTASKRKTVSRRKKKHISNLISSVTHGSILESWILTYGLIKIWYRNNYPAWNQERKEDLHSIPMIPFGFTLCRISLYYL